MVQHYILVEGINIYANVFDTNQLSVIRGSSFLLKRAIDHIKNHFSDQLIAISTGASSGLFLIKHGISPLTIVNNVADELNQPEKGFNLFTFVVEYSSADNLLLAKEQLVAQLRMRQMQSLTLAPDVSSKTIEELNYPDQLEGRRIANAHRKVTIQNKSRQLSHSVLSRWEYGKDLKHSYYFQENKLKNPADLDKLRNYNFCAHFEDLAENNRYSKLNGKIAVIYMDGNSFSKKQKKRLEQAQANNEDLIKAQQEFDHILQANRSEFLIQLLLTMIDENSDSRFNQILLRKGDKKIIQFETLLWGGDEMLFVLPAWLGFEFIHYFFEQTKDWNIGDPLTHAAGMVFCSAKTPIKNIQNLAKSLADTLKEVQVIDSPNNKIGRDQNAWNYIILESIDYPTNSNIADFNKKHYGKLAATRPKFIPASNNWNKQEQLLKKLIHNGLIPRRQLYRLVQAITSPEAKDQKSTLSWAALNVTNTIDNETLQEKHEQRLIEVSEHKEELLENLPIVAKQMFSLDIEDPKQRIWLWIYLYELWDYICPQTVRPAEVA